MPANRSREVAASAIWKATVRPWPTAFEPVLIAPAWQSDLAQAARSATTASSTGKSSALTQMRPRGVYSTMASAMSEANAAGIDISAGHGVEFGRFDSFRQTQTHQQKFIGPAPPTTDSRPRST